MKVINATFFIRAEKREDFLEKAQRLIASSRAEEGCLAYDLYESTTEENKFVMVEQWRDDEAVSTHNKTAALQELFKAMPDYASKETQLIVTNA